MIIPFLDSHTEKTKELFEHSHFYDAHAFENLDGGLSFVAQTKDTIVGAIVVCNNAYINYLVVHPKYRGRGIGTSLLQHVLDTTSKPLRLTCMPNVCSFYERFGFTYLQLAADSRIEMTFRK